MFHDANVHRHSHHVSVVRLRQQVLYQLSRYPEGLLFAELHQDQKVHDEVHPLTVTDKRVPDRQIPQNRRQNLLSFVGLVVDCAYHVFLNRVLE